VGTLQGGLLGETSKPVRDIQIQTLEQKADYLRRKKGKDAFQKPLRQTKGQNFDLVRQNVYVEVQSNQGGKRKLKGRNEGGNTTRAVGRGGLSWRSDQERECTPEKGGIKGRRRGSNEGEGNSTRFEAVRIWLQV